MLNSFVGVLITSQDATTMASTSLESIEDAVVHSTGKRRNDSDVNSSSKKKKFSRNAFKQKAMNAAVAVLAEMGTMEKAVSFIEDPKNRLQNKVTLNLWAFTAGLFSKGSSLQTMADAKESLHKRLVAPPEYGSFALFCETVIFTLWLCRA